MNFLKRLWVSCLVLGFVNLLTGQENAREELTKVKLHQLLELKVASAKQYSNPYADVELLIELTTPEGKKLTHFGFFDGNNQWKIRFSPDRQGRWSYKYWFTDQKEKVAGEFLCIQGDGLGLVCKNELNPFWLGRSGSPKTLFRSFHVGDRFFATNWDDPLNPDDGNARTAFLDWLQENKYNMLSIASLFTNRNEKGRGEGWQTPKLWPIVPEEYQKMEIILDELYKRDITVFPFAGFFGARGAWPVNPEEQEVYVKYILARVGHYRNLMLAVAGPEPFWRKNRNQYYGEMRLVDIKRLGSFIDSLDVHNHILTVHNEKRASQYGDPFIDEPWYDMSTLQGPTTVDCDKLYAGLTSNHHRYKPVFAQETLWAGNEFHPKYTDDQIRKNVYSILFAGAILNFADMNGNSSTGFTGNLNLAERKQHKHDIVRKVWDWFETIPFHQMKNRQDLVKQGFCLANEGQEYYVYLDTIGEVELFIDFPYGFQAEWINAQNYSDVRKVDATKTPKGAAVYNTPKDGNDWILHVYAQKPQVIATGNFPDLAVDAGGNIHVAYNRGGLKYKKYDAKAKKWLPEQVLDCECYNVKRSDPDIVVDSKGNPHIVCGKDYIGMYDGKWKKSQPGIIRDVELAIDKYDNLYVNHREGNNGGYIGFKTKKPGTIEWETLPDPDQKHKGDNNHVYPDIFIASESQIHLVQRHGPEVEVTYRFSPDGGKTWTIDEPVVNERSEAPHIVAENSGVVYIATGNGLVYERNLDGKWNLIGRKVNARSRMQPELGIDSQENIYLTAFGGRYNTRFKSVWMGENIIGSITGKPVGFVETAGAQDYAVVVWEEGKGNADEGLEDDASIVIGILYPDGRLVGLSE